MADDEQFSLCWNNFNSNLSAGFHESLCRGDLVDVTLAAEGQFVKAHRLVLSVCSPYFRRMFTQMPANQHAFVFLKDVSHSALKDLIQFMYCGEVNVKQDALPAFISTAEALQIKGLTDGEPAPSQSPAKPSTPAPQSTIPAPTMTTTTTTTSPRARSSNQRNRSSYKLESEDSGDENKPTNQLVLSTQSQQHTLVQQLTQKRPAQRSITPHTTPIVKRIKNSDPLEGTEPTQITVQTVVDNKSNSGEAEFIDLPIDLPTKSEPDYTEDAGDVETAEQETTYVEDDSYGDMKYDESYFTENDETATAPTTSATVKQSASFSESYVSDTGDQATTEAQEIPRRRPGRPRKNPENENREMRIDDIIELALKEEPEPVTYVSVIKGGMAVLYDGHHFRHQFKRKGCMVYRCIRFDSKKCPARIMVHKSLVYPVDVAHNHSDYALMELAVSVPPVKRIETRNLNDKNKPETTPVVYEIVNVPQVKILNNDGNSKPKINDIITIPAAQSEPKPKPKVSLLSSLANITVQNVTEENSAVLYTTTTTRIPDPVLPIKPKEKPKLGAISSQDLKEKMKKRLQMALLNAKK